MYFRPWSADAAPRWDEHWGSGWAHSHRGWNSWNRSSMPQVAPLPVYQRQYTGNRYPSIEQQQVLRVQSYRYQPRDVVVQQYYQVQPAPYAHGNPRKQVQKEAKREQKRVEQQAKFERKKYKHERDEGKRERKEDKRERKEDKRE